MGDGSMTRRDYILIAGAFARARAQAGDGAESDGVVHAARIMAEELATTNSGFKPERFLKACGLRDDEIVLGVDAR